ncbi:hypothetical protein ACFVS2_28215 [Brevibacillus sp. NPDC058079]|uniref:hypothetical protein n=1 Tax=Brevibacillus sp. NPDC058079 TaxID=3346330 RepID=UPI0036E2F4A2
MKHLKRILAFTLVLSIIFTGVFNPSLASAQMVNISESPDEVILDDPTKYDGKPSSNSQQRASLRSENPLMDHVKVVAFFAAIRGYITYFEREVTKKIVNKVTRAVKDLVEEYGVDKLSWKGPKRSGRNDDNHTLFSLSYDRVQILRVDMKVVKPNGGTERFGDIHMHVQPDMGDHIPIAMVPFGNDLPKFPW